MSTGTALVEDWVETSIDAHPWMSKLDEYDRPTEPRGSVGLYFTPKRKRWPLVKLSLITASLFGDGVRVSCAQKDGPNEWFIERGVPFGLVPRLVVALHAVTEHVEEQKP